MEMDRWWERHDKVEMGGYKKSEVEDATGRIPLLLDKCVVGGKIDLTVAYLHTIYCRAAGFVQRVKQKTRNTHKWQWYVPAYSTLRT
jgi:hypothetical protein